MKNPTDELIKMYDEKLACLRAQLAEVSAIDEYINRFYPHLDKISNRKERIAHLIGCSRATEVQLAEAQKENAALKARLKPVEEVCEKWSSDLKNNSRPLPGTLLESLYICDLEQAVKAACECV